MLLFSINQEKKKDGSWRCLHLFALYQLKKKKKKLSFASVKKVKVVLNENKAVGRGETEQSRTVKALEEVSVH